MATADQVKAAIRSHAHGDDTRFYAIAMQVAAQAARGRPRQVRDGAARAVQLHRLRFVVRML
jgi:hypothetical protein